MNLLASTTALQGFAGLLWARLAALFTPDAPKPPSRAKAIGYAELAGFEASDDAPCPYTERRLVEAFWRGREEGQCSDNWVGQAARRQPSL